MNNIIAVSPRIADYLNPVGEDGNDEKSSPIDDKGCEESLGTGAHSTDGPEAIHAPEEEVKATKTVRSPPTPTQQEIDEHRVSHLPYRSWCPECVEAFGRERGHRRQEESRSIPLVSCDYMYLTKNGMFAREELDEAQRDASTRVLIMYCGATQTPFANAVPHKGADAEGYVVECVRQNILWLGHSKVTIRSDNEPALLQVVTRSVAALKMSGVENVVDEGSVPSDPQTNGAAEATVRLMKGTFKTLLLGLERQLNARIPLDHPIISWMLAHGAMLRTLLVKGEDGKTAHQRVRGSTGNLRLLAFGELCRYKCRAQEGGIAGTKWRFSIGVWLGVDKRTGQYIVYDGTMGGSNTQERSFPCQCPRSGLLRQSSL